MYRRLSKPLISRSFFLFGARGTGKTTFIRSFLKKETCKEINLLNPDLEQQYKDKPSTLIQELDALRSSEIQWIFIDEVQKVPELLDVVHNEIVTHKRFLFALSGSSARKLKRGSANLLAGRALENHLFPLTSFELGKEFDLEFVLRWGSLPEVFTLDEETRIEYLKSYTQIYLKEEILLEQLIRQIKPFRAFLEITAQSNSEIVNYSKIARDIGSDPVSVKNYFQILEDTLLGFHLEAFHESVRKRQRQNPKFYFFDLGIKRAIERKSQIPIEPKTFTYGQAFETWIISEVYRLNHYLKKDWKLSYLRTKDDVEIDLIIEKPDDSKICIEIKSTEFIRDVDLGNYIKISSDIKNSIAYCFSKDPSKKQIGHIQCIHWHDGLVEIFK